MDCNTENISLILAYLWNDEKKDYEIEYDTDVVDDLDEQIKWAEQEGCTEHIFYNLMILKKEFKEND